MSADVEHTIWHNLASKPVIFTISTHCCTQGPDREDKSEDLPPQPSDTASFNRWGISRLNDASSNLLTNPHITA
jgi:hypothetical protein